MKASRQQKIKETGNLRENHIDENSVKALRASINYEAKRNEYALYRIFRNVMKVMSRYHSERIEGAAQIIPTLIWQRVCRERDRK